MIIYPVAGSAAGPNTDSTNDIMLTSSGGPGNEYTASGSDYVVELTSDDDDPVGKRGIKITYKLIYPG